MRLLQREDLPYNIDDPQTSEDLRLKYRYLEIRRSDLGENLRLRHRITKIVRDLDDPQRIEKPERRFLLTKRVLLQIPTNTRQRGQN